MKLDKKEVYRGTYKGVQFEICSFISEAIPTIDIPEKKNWTFYLILQLTRIPVESNPDAYWIEPKRIRLSNTSTRDMITYDYSDSPLSSLDWHGGITWYSKESTEDNTPEERVIKAGCDFQHYWDEGREYDLDYVLSEVKLCIDSFKERVPGYKWHCSTLGGYWDSSEGEVSEDGNSFMSFKGKEWRIQQGWDKVEMENK